MPLQSGARLGPYEILTLLGAGGMGEVYRATDTNLKRQVAIKVLPESLAQDPERLARFQREAEVLAALNHPNIAHIHGYEESGGIQALVMELVEGPTLADRIAHGPIPLPEALPIAKQIAEALEAAHEQGIIHRDLKPANIKVREDGTVKVLDFGLAKLVDPAATGAPSDPGVTASPTITTPAMTQAGMILGTAAYMSPEQASGKPVDKRSDLWAFGVVLFEMLTGQRLFDGETVSHVLAAVLKTDPDWSLLPAGTPGALRRLLARCLDKDRKRRLDSAAAARLEIEDALAAPAATAPQLPNGRRLALPVIAALVGTVALVVGAVLGGWLWSSRIPPPQVTVSRLTLSLPPGVELGYQTPLLAISPDGTQVAYIGTRGAVQQLYLRRMDNVEARPLSGTEGVGWAFFSPDGQSLAFLAGGKLKKMSTSGGVPVTLADAGPQGGDWGDDDTIVFRGPGEAGFLEIPAAGGAARSVLPIDPSGRQATPRIPHFLPGGRTLLFTSSPATAATADEGLVEVLTVATGARKVLIQGGSDPHYLPTGHIVFFRSGTLLAAPFDLGRLEVTGSPVPVLENVRESVIGQGAFGCARTGTCLYVAGGMAGARRTAALVDRTGAAVRLPMAPQSYGSPRFSPAGDKIAFWLERQNCDIAVFETARGVLTRLSLDGDNHNPAWTPDGNRITYVSQKKAGAGYELFWKPADGSGTEERVSQSRQNLAPVTPFSWSPDGSVIAFVKGGDIWLLPLSGDRQPRPFFESRATETTPAFSPDGHWLAYVSDESGRPEIYVRPFPGPGAKYEVSSAGGTEPVWARSGRELFFRSGDGMMVSQIDAHAAFSATKPALLFTGVFERMANRVSYDVSPDGQRFVMFESGDDPQSSSQVNVVLNWTEELKHLVPTKN